MTLQDMEQSFFEKAVGGFDTGKSFRTFKELNIATSAVYTIKIVVPVNSTLTHLEVMIDSGSLKLETLAGGTDGTAFAETLPRFKTNNMIGVPAYTVQDSVLGGGTQTGGVLIDVLRVKADTNAGRATSVGSTESDSRGIAPGTYYWKFTNLSNTDVLTGTFKVRWTEHA